MSCMICRQSDVTLFNIFNVASTYGNINHTIADDFNELFGEKVKLYLKPISCVCNSCKNILETISIMRRSIWNLITDPKSPAVVGKLCKLWKAFASLKLDREDIEDIQNQENRIPTPNLVYLTYSVDYNSFLEKQIAEQERRRSLSLYSGNARSDTDTSVVTKVQDQNQDASNKKKRGRKRGHSWSRKKGGRKLRPLSRSNASSSYRKGRSKNTIERYTPYTDISTCYSARSFTRRNIRSPTSIRSSSRTCTRSVSQLQNEEVLNYRKDLIYCTVRNCNMFSDKVREMNIHNVEEHGMSRSILCLECKEEFTTIYLRNLHSKSHTYSLFCMMCGIEKEDTVELLKHLDEHMVYSVPCKYCDKSFLSASLKDEHFMSSHKYKRRRRIFKKRLILDRIVKDGENQEQPPEEVEFGPRYTDVTWEEEKDMGDVTIEALKERGVPVYTDEDGVMSIEEFDFQESEMSDPQTPQSSRTLLSRTPQNEIDIEECVLSSLSEENSDKGET